MRIQESGSSDAMIGQALGVNKNLAEIASILRTAFPLSAYQGTFTCSAAATTTVTDANVKATSTILLTPTNAAAATLQAGASHLYLSARTEATSFALATADSGSAAGTETFQYLIVNTG